jgi:hypothetical protein
MTTNHMEMVVEITPDTSCISHTPLTMDNVKHNIGTNYNASYTDSYNFYGNPGR